MQSLSVRKAVMLAAATGATTTAWFGPTVGGPKTFQANLAGTGAIDAVVEIHGSLDGSNLGAIVGTISIAGTTTVSGGFALNEPWLYFRAKLVSINGTSASIGVFCGETV